MSNEIHCQHGDTLYILVEPAETFLTAKNICKQKKGILAEHIDDAGYQIISDCGNLQKQYWIGLIYNQIFCHDNPQKRYSWFTEEHETCRSPSPLTISNHPQTGWCQAVTIRPIRSRQSANNSFPSAKMFSCDLSKPYICQINNSTHSVTTPKMERITTGSDLELSSATEQLHSATKEIDLTDGISSAQWMTASTGRATIIGAAAASVVALALVFFLAYIVTKYTKQTRMRQSSLAGRTRKTALGLDHIYCRNANGKSISTISPPVCRNVLSNDHVIICRDEVHVSEEGSETEAENPYIRVKDIKPEEIVGKQIANIRFFKNTNRKVPEKTYENLKNRNENYAVKEERMYENLRSKESDSDDKTKTSNAMDSSSVIYFELDDPDTSDAALSFGAHVKRS